MRRKTYIKSILITVCALLITRAGAVAGVAGFTLQQDPDVHILVLHAYHAGYKWTDDIMRGIEDSLMLRYPGSLNDADAGRDFDGDIELHVEYMDTKRIYNPSYLATLVELYRRKYQDLPLDLIISSDDNAFNFLLEHRDSLWPQVPVVFCGVNYFKSSRLEGRSGFTGVNETLDVRATLDLMLELHPQTEQIVIVNDMTTTGRSIHPYVMDVIPDYQDRVAFTYLDDESMDKVLETVATLSSDSLILFISFFKDGTGQFFEFDESIAMVTEASPVPIYSIWDFYLGYGIVGGRLASGYYQGEAAAQLAQRILQGEAVEDVPVIQESPNHYMFDYAQMQQFGLHPRDLPEDSIMLNRPITFYEQYKWWIWGSSTLLVLVGVILAVISTKNAALRRAEEALRVSNQDIEAARASLEAQATQVWETVQTYAAHLKKVGAGDFSARLSLAAIDFSVDDPLLSLGRDLNTMTESFQDMIAQERHQREVIEAQQRAIQQLSTPVIPIMDVPNVGAIIVLPLIGDIDTERAQMIMRHALQGISEHNAQCVILDMTGVPIMDTGVINHINKTIHAARLKGARTIVTGISDAVAEAIVDLGIDWGAVETLSDLRTGLIVALHRMGIQISVGR